MRQLPPAVLAYVGDAVYELYVRRQMVLKGLQKVNFLHRQVVNWVNASTQAKLYHLLEENFLTEEEKGVARRGRNAKVGQVPKNANVADYRHSTGLECLIGYLHLKGNDQRVQELLSYLDELS
ncbi:MAG: ribonuclease III [Thermoanaerobacteraceae bacterium]|nr:ribonuclease III [Thermoanaerobacteraceae bacterium]